MMQSGQSLANYKPIQLEAAPEFTIEQEQEFIDCITTARANDNRESFGAFVIRNSQQSTAKRLGALLAEATTEEHELNRESFTQRLSRLHVDEGRRNAITAHFQLLGSVRAVLLCGLEDDPSVSNLARSDIELFTMNNNAQRGRLPISLDEPTRPLTATLHEGDILVFDHSQLHGFESLTRNRMSVGYFAPTQEPM